MLPTDPLRLNKKQRGARAETIAASYLLKRGYQIIKTNIFTPFGEIDILAKKNRTYIGVEVRSRSQWSDIDPLSTITSQKYQKLVRSLISLEWLYNRQLQIDVIAVEKDQVTHHLQAITAPATA